MSMASRSGDDGNSRLFGGKRVPKDTPRLEAVGAIEELNATVGLLLARTLETHLRSPLSRIQSELLDLMLELGTPREGAPLESTPAQFPVAALDAVDRDLEAAEGRCGPLTAVLLPGGHEAAAMLHLCRALTRRAERRVVSVARVERVPGVVLAYLNRLADLFFVLGRDVNLHAGVSEPEWITREDRDAEP